MIDQQQQSLSRRQANRIFGAVPTEDGARVIPVVDMTGDRLYRKPRSSHDPHVDAPIIIAVDQHDLVVAGSSHLVQHGTVEPGERDAVVSLDNALDVCIQQLHNPGGVQQRYGVYLIEGNHDLIENGPEFERRVKNSGIPFLLDESIVIKIRGAPLQLLGLSWTRARENRDAAIATAVSHLLNQRQPESFPILLAHHPHAFDAAAAASVPLTLAGHTHGGQLMLNDEYGFGPALFRYWSGLYSKGASKLVVSNGVGNWFPLRVRAPAELLHLTLLRSGN